MGRSSLASQAASWMQFFMDGGRGICASGWLGLMAATCRGGQEGRERLSGHRRLQHPLEAWARSKDRRGSPREAAGACPRAVRGLTLVTKAPPAAPPSASLGRKFSPRTCTGAGPSQRSYVLPFGPRTVSER